MICGGASLNIIVLCLVIFIVAALFSPMLYCSIIPHWPQKRWVLLFCFFSQRSYFAVLFSHHLFPVWKEPLHVSFGPAGVLSQNRFSCYGWERARLSSWVHPNCLSPPPVHFIPSLLYPSFHPFPLPSFYLCYLLPAAPCCLSVFTLTAALL